MRTLTSFIDSRKCLVFLFFFALSTGFWFFQAFNEVYEEEFDIAVQVEDLPQGATLTVCPPRTVRVRLKDRGITLMGYKYSKFRPSLLIDSTRFKKSQTHLRLTEAEMKSSLKPQMAAGTEIVSIRPDTIEIFYRVAVGK